MELSKKLVILFIRFIDGHVCPAFFVPFILILLSHIDLLEINVLAQLEVEHVQAVCPRAQPLHVAFEELTFPESPEELERFRLDFLGQVTVFHESKASFVVARQLLVIIVIEFIEVAIHTFDVLLMV